MLMAKMALTVVMLAMVVFLLTVVLMAVMIQVRQPYLAGLELVQVQVADQVVSLLKAGLSLVTFWHLGL